MSYLLKGNISERPRQHELRQAWGQFVTDLGDQNGGWDWYATLTFRDISYPGAPHWTKPGLGYTKRAWDRFVVELGLRKGLHDVRWVYGREYQQWRGVPHFHALIGGVAGLRLEEAQSWWFRNYGIARIEPYDRSRGAGFYLCKYVNKQFGDIHFSKGLKM